MTQPFEGVFGNNCELRIIEFLLPLKGMEFNVTELAKETGVSRPTATRVIKKFVDHGVMKVAQTRGGANYYEINTESPFIRLFEDLNNIVIEQMLDEETLYQIHEAIQAFSPIKPSVEREKKIAPEIPIYKFETIPWFRSKPEQGRVPCLPGQSPILFQGGGVHGTGAG